MNATQEQPVTSNKVLKMRLLVFEFEKMRRLSLLETQKMRKGIHGRDSAHTLKEDCKIE